MNKNSIKAILFGGLLIALFSTIPILSLLWFVWSVLGAIAAMRIYCGSSLNEPIKPSGGIIVGLGAGLIGGVICFILAPVMQILSLMVVSFVDKPNRKLAKHFGESLEFYFEKIAVFQIPISLVCSVIIVALAIGGGYLGWMIFCKNERPAISGVVTNPASGF